MNKIKLALVATAIMAAIGGAFATRPCVQCENSTQYWFDGVNYYPAGTYGVHYDCWNTAGTCTYYRPDPAFHPNVYVPCRTGVFEPIYGR
jgi:hypothetical protein